MKKSLPVMIKIKNFNIKIMKKIKFINWIQEIIAYSYTCNFFTITLSCSNDNNIGVDPVIVNQNNSFSFELSNANNITKIFEYDWKNSGSQANIGILTTAQATQMDVKVFDA